MFIITHRKIFLIIGAIVVIASGLIFFSLGLKSGIDFTGGSLTEVRYGTLPDKVAVENVLNELGFTDSSIRHSSGDLGESYIVTTRTLDVSEQQSLETELLSLAEDSTVIRNTSVGPVVGEEMRSKSFWAIGAVMVVTIIYVAFAFMGIGYPVSSWIYGLFTVLVLIHDVLVPLAVMSILGYFWGIDADLLFVTALLTILGYSVNDTIVIFDRIREKLTRYRNEKRTKVRQAGGVDREEVTYTLTKPFAEIVGAAVYETMARSINTSLTVLLALIALYFFGSAVTKTFTLILIAGVISGAYSSIFIASPLLVWYEEKFGNNKSS